MTTPDILPYKPSGRVIIETPPVSEENTGDRKSERAKKKMQKKIERAQKKAQKKEAKQKAAKQKAAAKDSARINAAAKTTANTKTFIEQPSVPQETISLPTLTIACSALPLLAACLIVATKIRRKS